MRIISLNKNIKIAIIGDRVAILDSRQTANNMGNDLDNYKINHNNETDVQWFYSSEAKVEFNQRKIIVFFDLIRLKETLQFLNSSISEVENHKFPLSKYALKQIIKHIKDNLKQYSAEEINHNIDIADDTHNQLNIQDNQLYLTLLARYSGNLKVIEYLKYHYSHDTNIVRNLLLNPAMNPIFDDFQYWIKKNNHHKDSKIIHDIIENKIFNKIMAKNKNNERKTILDILPVKYLDFNQEWSAQLLQDQEDAKWILESILHNLNFYTFINAPYVYQNISTQSMIDWLGYIIKNKYYLELMRVIGANGLIKNVPSDLLNEIFKLIVDNGSRCVHEMNMCTIYNKQSIFIDRITKENIEYLLEKANKDLEIKELVLVNQHLINKINHQQAEKLIDEKIIKYIHTDRFDKILHHITIQNKISDKFINQLLDKDLIELEDRKLLYFLLLPNVVDHIVVNYINKSKVDSHRHSTASTKASLKGKFFSLVEKIFEQDSYLDILKNDPLTLNSLFNSVFFYLNDERREQLISIAENNKKFSFYALFYQKSFVEQLSSKPYGHKLLLRIMNNWCQTDQHTLFLTISNNKEIIEMMSKNRSVITELFSMIMERCDDINVNFIRKISTCDHFIKKVHPNVLSEHLVKQKDAVVIENLLSALT